MIFQWFEGTVREVFIAIDTLQVFICFQLAALFFFRAIKNPRSLKVNLGWFIVFFSYGLLTGLISFRFFYIPSEIWVENETFFSLLGLIPLISILFMMEMMLQKYNKTYYFFTLFGIIVGIISVFISQDISKFIFNFYLIALLIFGITFFKKLIQLSTGIVRKNVVIFTISFFTLVIFGMMSSPSRYEDLSLMGIDITLWAFIGRIVQIVSFIIIAAVLFKLPIFFEVNWKENLIQIYIILRGAGLTFFHNKFQEASMDEENRRGMDEELVGGGMVGIAAMLKEISQSTEELKTIDHVDQKIILEHSEYFFIALNVKEVMLIYWTKLYQLKNIIETYFNDFLENWTGDLDVFKPLGNYVKEIFQ
jgi:hypothetical protein